MIEQDNKEKYYTEVWDSVNTKSNGRKGSLSTENIFKFADELLERQRSNGEQPKGGLYIMSKTEQGIVKRALKDSVTDAAPQQSPIQSNQDFKWECNQCGSQEFTSALSESDLEYLACTGCGGDEFHKEYISAAPSAPIEAQLSVTQALVQAADLMEAMHDTVPSKSRGAAIRALIPSTQAPKEVK